MTSADVARELNTDAKTLRRFIRQDPTYRNAGAGGRYTFEAKDMATLHRRFTAWQDGLVKKAATKAPARPKHKLTRADHDAAVWAEEGDVVIPRMTPSLRAAAQARVDRLEAALIERGLHISQIREREGWSKVPTNADELAHA